MTDVQIGNHVFVTMESCLKYKSVLIPDFDDSIEFVNKDAYPSSAPLII